MKDRIEEAIPVPEYKEKKCGILGNEVRDIIKEVEKIIYVQVNWNQDSMVMAEEALKNNQKEARQIRTWLKRIIGE